MTITLHAVPAGGRSMWQALEGILWFCRFTGLFTVLAVYRVSDSRCDVVIES